MIKLKISSILIAITTLSVILSGCGDDNVSSKKVEETIDDQNIELTTKDKARFQRAKIVFFSLPSPIETARILKKSGAIYDKNFLNSTANVTKYTTSVNKAIGLGIYVADLSYANSFKQQQDCLDYFAAVQTLSDGLSLSNIFTPEFVDSIKENINSEDSVLKYLSESYWEANSQLKENERESVAALVAAGGWIEGLHIACSLADVKDPNNPLVNRIAEQQVSLKQLINYLVSFKDPKVLQEMTEDLKDLKESFDEIEVKIERRTKEVGNDGVATVGSKKTYHYPDGVMEEIVSKVEMIRSKYI